MDKIKEKELRLDVKIYLNQYLLLQEFKDGLENGE